MVDRAVEREGSSSSRACENGSISILDQSRRVLHHGGEAGAMVGDLPAGRGAGTIDRWNLCRSEIYWLAEVLNVCVKVICKNRIDSLGVGRDFSLLLKLVRMMSSLRLAFSARPFMQ